MHISFQISGYYKSKMLTGSNHPAPQEGQRELVSNNESQLRHLPPEALSSCLLLHKLSYLLPCLPRGTLRMGSEETRMLKATWVPLRGPQAEEHRLGTHTTETDRLPVLGAGSPRLRWRQGVQTAVRPLCILTWSPRCVRVS